MFLTFVVCISVFAAGSCAVPGCASRDYGYGSTVCVCNSTYCDTVEPTTKDQLTKGVIRHYVSTKAGKRLEVMNMKFSPSSSKDGKAVTFTVDRKSRYQEMLGFGGAATDAATINAFSLSPGVRNKLIRSYFAEDGIGYTFIRVPMAGSDFSTHHYEYTDNYPNDTTLAHFNLTDEDYNYKIPFIKRAKRVSPSKVKLFTAAWSAPDWMKNINSTTKASSLKEKYYQVYANYSMKFFDFYAAAGLHFWGMTPQNEPSHGLTMGAFNSMGWNSQQMQNYIVTNLCPTLKSAGYSHIKVMINDDQRTNVPQWLELYKNSSIQECVSGMAVHWYTDRYSPANILSEAHEKYPNKFLLYTEACVVHGRQEPAVTLGSWEKGVQYMTDIIQVTKNWVTGWVDWNMALDVDGGPNWVNNTVDSPIIVNATANEFYKQPMFYALAHFAKFVTPGSVRIGLKSQQNSSIEHVAFLTRENITIVILHNTATEEVEAVINDPDSGSVSLKIQANSMNTILFKA